MRITRDREFNVVDGSPRRLEARRINGEIAINILSVGRPVVREVAVLKYEPPLFVAFEIVGPFEKPAGVVTGRRCMRLQRGRHGSERGGRDMATVLL